jgi:hypothetical protein
VTVQTRSDWEARVRLFIAVFFYRWHALHPLGIRAMLPLLEPSAPHVIEASTMSEFVATLFADLQRDIIDAHELLARSWLLTNDGEELLEKQELQR